MSFRHCPAQSRRVAVRYIVPVLLAAALLPVASDTAAASPAQLRVPALHWAACGDGFECTTATVPLDYDHPDSRTVHVAVTRLPASGPSVQRIGSLLVNPGGPGASAIDFLPSTLPPVALRLRSRAPRSLATSRDFSY